MTVYRFSAAPTVGSTVIEGTIDEVLGAVAQSIEPDEFYWINEDHDVSGLELLDRLVALQQLAEPTHTYVDGVSFCRAVGGRPGEYLIERVTR